MKTIAGTLNKKGRGKRLPQSTLRPFSNGPKDHVAISESGEAYVLTTMLGTRIVFDICGRCSVHVKNCKCASGASLPRSAEYCWDGDLARSKNEEWDYHHPDYRGSFTARETRKNLRMNLPDIERRNVASLATVHRKKKLSIYIDRARRSRAEGVERLLRGKRK